MPEELDPFAAPVSKRRPLLGATILLIEDSRYCSEAVRLMCLRSGARLRRADCLTSARRHLATYRPDVMLVDLGLPDGSGLDFIEEMQKASPQKILAVSGNVTADVQTAALAAGAQGFLAKPFGDIKHFQQVVGGILRGKGAMPDIHPNNQADIPSFDQQALLDDLDHVRRILERALPVGDLGRLRYCAQFVASVAQTVDDPELVENAQHFFQRMDAGGSGVQSGQKMLEIMQQRLLAGPQFASVA